VSQLN